MAGDRQRGDDAALVREVAAGSEAALGMLYDRYIDAVYAAEGRPLIRFAAQPSRMAGWSSIPTQSSAPSDP